MMYAKIFYKNIHVELKKQAYYYFVNHILLIKWVWSLKWVWFSSCNPLLRILRTGLDVPHFLYLS
jgi:hypothetical protein